MPQSFGRQLAKANLVLLVYLVCAVLAVALVESDESFLPPGNWLTGFDGGQLLPYTVLYGLPAPLALGFGLLVRPFWRGVVLVLGLICLVQIAFSLSITALRGLHLAAWRGEVLATLQAEPRLSAVDHSFVDDNADGLIDGIVVTATLHRDDLPVGTYRLRVTLSPPDEPNRWLGLSNLDLVLAPSIQSRVPITAKFNPESLLREGDEGEVASVDLAIAFELSRFMELSENDRFLLMLCRWATAPCPTTPLAGDPSFSSELLQLTRHEAGDRVVLARNQIQREQVIVTGILGDFGRDLDGDGLFDELVVELAVDSIYDGPLFLRGRLKGFDPPFISHDAPIAVGQTKLELTIDGARLRSAGKDGPYQVHSWAILNNSPYCPRLPCDHKHQPVWTIYLPAYETKAYRAAQFQ